MHRAIASVKGQWIAEHLAAKEYCNLEAQQCFENQLVPTDNQDFFSSDGFLVDNLPVFHFIKL